METYNFEFNKIEENIRGLDTFDKKEKYLISLLARAEIISKKTDYLNDELGIISKIKFMLDDIKYGIKKLEEDIKKIPDVRDKIICIEVRLRELNKRIKDLKGTLQYDAIRGGYEDTLKWDQHIDRLKSYKKVYYENLEYWKTNIDIVILYAPRNIEPKEYEEPELKPSEKIKWLGTEVQLVYLFTELVKQNLISSDSFSVYGKGYKIIAKMFQKKNGTGYNNKQLAQTYQNLGANKEGKPINPQKLDYIIKETQKKE